VNQTHKDQTAPFGRILMIGLEKVGKTTLIKRLSSGIFDPNTRPTLGYQILKTVMSNLSFNIYDMGGQKKFRDLWFKTLDLPDAIVFVVDLTRLKENQDVVREIYQKIIEKYCSSSYNIPVLILGNKMDLIPIQERFILYKLLHSISQIDENQSSKENVRHVGLLSALTNEGVFENFRWLASKAIQLKMISDSALSKIDGSKLSEVVSIPEGGKFIASFQEIWVFNQGGIELYSYTVDNTFDTSLLGGFLVALQNFSRQFFKHDLAYFVVGNSKLTLYSESEALIYILGRSERDESNDDIMQEMKELHDSFIKLYGTHLVKFNGNVSPFQNFEKDHRNLLQ
jgi:small GTP-binding protein